MNQTIKDINKISIEEFNEITLYLASIDPLFSKGLNLVLSGKSAEDAIESTMTSEDSILVLSTNYGEISESSILEKIEDSQLKKNGEKFIIDVTNKIKEKEEEKVA